MNLIEFKHVFCDDDLLCYFVDIMEMCINFLGRDSQERHFIMRHLNGELNFETFQ